MYFWFCSTERVPEHFYEMNTSDNTPLYKTNKAKLVKLNPIYRAEAAAVIFWYQGNGRVDMLNCTRRQCVIVCKQKL